MLENLHEFLPDEISDEAAYHLSNFVMQIATTLDEIYYCQILRYMRKLESKKANYSSFIDKNMPETPF